MIVETYCQFILFLSTNFRWNLVLKTSIIFPYIATEEVNVLGENKDVF